MKIPSTFAFLAAGLLSATVAQSQIFIYNFNDNSNGTTTVSTGSNTATATIKNSSNVATNLRGASGSGVSGLSGDYAFDNAAASTGMGSSGTGGYATATIGTAMDSLTSFTISGWMNPQTQINNAARVVEQVTGSTSTWRLLSDNAGRLTLQIATPTSGGYIQTTSAIGSAYSGTGQWTFFAVTYDGTIAANNVKFYVGGTNSSVSQVGSIASLNGGTLGINTGSMVMGGGPTRPLDALLDNLRIDGVTSGASGVLSSAQLETIRANAVPEPSTLALVVIPIGLVLALRRRRSAA